LTVLFLVQVGEPGEYESSFVVTHGTGAGPRPLGGVLYRGIAMRAEIAKESDVD